MESGKSCGLDDVTSNDLKLHEESSITGLHEVVKCSILSGKFPGEWKKAKVASIEGVKVKLLKLSAHIFIINP